MSTDANDYTIMISVMQGIFLQVDSIKDKTNLLKYHLFMIKFLPKFPEIVRKEVTKRVNMIQEPEDMDSLLLEFDKFKWLFTEKSDPAPKKNHNKHPPRYKKRAHAIKKMCSSNM